MLVIMKEGRMLVRMKEGGILSVGARGDSATLRAKRVRIWKSEWDFSLYYVLFRMIGCFLLEESVAVPQNDGAWGDKAVVKTKKI